LLEKGDIYPSAKDAERIERENYYERLLLNESTGNYKMVHENGVIRKVPKDPLVPIPQTISDISADLLMGEFPNIVLPQTSEQDNFNDWAMDTDLGSRLLEAATYVSAVGTVFSSLYKIDDEINYTLKASNKVTWEETNGKITNVKFILGITRTANGVNQVYEIQEWSINKGQLLIQHYEAEVRISDRKVKRVDVLSPEQRPGLDFVPIAKWVNVGIMGQPNGRSDYSGKSQLFSEIDNRVDQNNNTIEENQDPWKAIPAGILDERGEFNRSNYANKMFEKTGGGQADNTVDVVTWDANMPASFQQIETMIDLTFFTSRLSNPITGRLKGGQSDSGRSLKWQSVSTISMKNRKEKYAASFLRDFVNQWSRLSGTEIDKKEIKIIWQDGLPIDEQEKTETVVQQVNAGLMSKETAIKELQELSTEDAQKELEKIQADETAAAELEARSVSPLVI
jgi:hypothetical protein